MRIETEINLMPGEDRNFDWMAIDADTYEWGCPIGFGSTEREAIDDLSTKLEEQ